MRNNLCSEFDYFHPTMPTIPARSAISSASSSSSASAENRFGANQNDQKRVFAIPIDDRPDPNPERGLNFDSIILDECCFWDVKGFDSPPPLIKPVSMFNSLRFWDVLLFPLMEKGRLNSAITVIDKDRFFLPTTTMFRNPDLVLSITHVDKIKSVPGTQ